MNKIMGAKDIHGVDLIAEEYDEELIRNENRLIHAKKIKGK